MTRNTKIGAIKDDKEVYYATCPNNAHQTLVQLYYHPSFQRTINTLEQLNAFSKKMNDNEAAEQLSKARDALFKQLHERHDLRA